MKVFPITSVDWKRVKLLHPWVKYRRRFCKSFFVIWIKCNCWVIEFHEIEKGLWNFFYKMESVWIKLLIVGYHFTPWFPNCDHLTRLPFYTLITESKVFTYIAEKVLFSFSFSFKHLLDQDRCITNDQY